MAYDQTPNSSTTSSFQNPKPDSASVHVLYAGNLADDDFMWIVECTIEEFQKMLNSPVEWVNGLSTLPDWHLAGKDRSPAPAPVLLKNFTMRIQQRDNDSPSDLITIQGISYTGILSVRASHASAVMGVQNLQTFRDGGPAYTLANTDDVPDDASPFDSYWASIAVDPSTPSKKKLYAVNVDTMDARYYGHFEITLPGEGTPASRVAAAAAFILALGSDPQGFANMLNTLDQTTMYISPYGVNQGQKIRMAVAPNYTPQILYTSLDDSTYATCGMLDGGYDSTTNTGNVDNPIVKKYGVEGGEDSPGDTTTDLKTRPAG